MFNGKFVMQLFVIWHLSP